MVSYSMGNISIFNLNTGTQCFVYNVIIDNVNFPLYNYNNWENIELIMIGTS